MYGHEMIDSLNKHCLKFGWTRGKRLEIEVLKSAVYFYFDDYVDVLNLTKGFVDGSPFFSGSLHANPPYENICLCFRVKDCTFPDGTRMPSDHPNFISKRVVSVMTDDDGMFIREWIFEQNKKRWATSRVAINGYNDESGGIMFKTCALEEDAELLKEDSNGADDIGKDIVYCANMAILLLNTKNITTIDNPPPAKLNKKRIKNGKQPLFTYKTLRLQLPAKKRKNGDSSASATDNTTRLHLCRGHFKTYTEDKPLLGRFTGRYWWQPHARGDKTKGIVAKDYKVECGKDLK